MKKSINQLALSRVLTKSISGISLFFFLVILIATNTINAQQLPQISNFLGQTYMMNPGVAGASGDFEVRTMNRYQWVGVTDAPRTFILSLQGPLKDRNIGLGGYLFTDNVGPTRRTGIQLSYSYQLRINEYTRLGLGLSAGLLQFAIDGTKITLSDQNDPALYSQLNNQLLFDATFGAYLHADDYYIGISAPQLLRNKVDLFDSSDPSQSRLEDHYYLFAGYKWGVSEDFTIEPSILLKYNAPAPMNVDVGARVHYRDMIYLGGYYRVNEASSAMIGYEWKERLNISYAYDFTFANLGNYSDGTHEIQIGFRFGPELKAE